MRIKGKIAKILNTRELVINRGSGDGVKIGMEFVVWEPAMPILDPETQEPLGDLQREKVRVRVFETEPKFALARTYETYRETSSDNSILGSLGFQSRYVTKVKRINTRYAHDTSEYQEGVANVSVGDTVTQVPAQVSNVATEDNSDAQPNH